MQPQPASADPTDRALIALVLAGDHAAFERLVRRHNQRLYRAARAITRSDADAEDALQQTWLGVFRHLAQFRGDSAFSTWATRIAIREALAQIRKGGGAAVVAVVEEPTVEPSPADDHARHQLGALLERCLAAIPQGNREVMVLRDVLELDTAETATCLGLTEEAVRVRLHRGRAAVAAALTETFADHAAAIYGFDGERCDRITRAVMRNVRGPDLLPSP